MARRARRADADHACVRARLFEDRQQRCLAGDHRRIDGGGAGSLRESLQAVVCRHRARREARVVAGPRLSSCRMAAARGAAPDGRQRGTCRVNFSRTH